MAAIWLVLLFALGGWSQTPPAGVNSQTDANGAVDADGDGLPDALEQALLERFLPRFHISAIDCDQLPATFAPNETTPRPLARDGRIYGQAFPVNGMSASPRIELHFYHLWGRDCGRFSHPLDVEHVAVLLERQVLRSGDLPPAEALTRPAHTSAIWEWRALYWFAAGHQNTVCDVSHAARAETLVAEWMGPDVWISRNKHASYLARERCRLGCGGDTCPQMIPLPQVGVVNVGEPGRPMNGAVWTASDAWPLRSKMAPQVDAVAIAQIDAAGFGKIVAVNRALPPVRATILAGGETLDGVAVGGKHTGSALKTGRRATGSAMGRAFRAVKRTMGSTQPAGTDKGTPSLKSIP
ncbi:MAG: hypothetical protein KIT83_14860 [Bryobacterales bacterium]|nr:hypothetical protein [Bryobacterales bacterium]